MKKILVVDDDAAIHRLIGAIIQIMGDVEVTSAYNGREALDWARDHVPDLIISDVNMPDMDGLALCRAVRASETLGETPILMLTARGESQDKYDGFLQGADDYLVKPFDPTELQLRIKALLRRSPRAPAAAAAPPGRTDGLIGAGPLTLNAHRYLGTVDTNEFKLTASEFAILRHLVENADQVIGVETLLSQALDYPPKLGNPQVIHTHMKNIRAKMREAGVTAEFLSSSRRGYMLVSQG